jgi:hypothetical protein
MFLYINGLSAISDMQPTFIGMTELAWWPDSWRQVTDGNALCSFYTYREIIF